MTAQATFIRQVLISLVQYNESVKQGGALPDRKQVSIIKGVVKTWRRKERVSNPPYRHPSPGATCFNIEERTCML